MGKGTEGEESKQSAKEVDPWTILTSDKEFWGLGFFEQLDAGVCPPATAHSLIMTLSFLSQTSGQQRIEARHVNFSGVGHRRDLLVHPLRHLPGHHLLLHGRVALDASLPRGSSQEYHRL